MFTFPQQVRFRVAGEEGYKGGILIDNQFVICGCCGEVFEVEELEKLEAYNEWVDISEEIKGE